MNHLRKFFETKILWGDLRKIKTAKVITSMYIWLFLVPVSTKALANLKNVVEITVFGEKFEIVLSLPFSWKVFYLSAICFVIANIIFLLRCPRLVRDHPHFDDFQRQGKRLAELAIYSDDIAFAWGPLAENIDKQAQRVPSIDPSDPKHYFWPLYTDANKSRPCSRVMVGLMYALGLVLFSWVAVQNFVSVFCVR